METDMGPFFEFVCGITFGLLVLGAIVGFAWLYFDYCDIRIRVRDLENKD